MKDGTFLRPSEKLTESPDHRLVCTPPCALQEAIQKARNSRRNRQSTSPSPTKGISVISPDFCREGKEGEERLSQGQNGKFAGAPLEEEEEKKGTSSLSSGVRPPA